MTYGNYMGQNPYMFNQHPSYFASAMQQNYGLPVTQQPQQPTQNQQQTITTQPPIMQPQASGKIIPVSNKDEATAAQVDLVYGTPSFFHNKSQNEIYLKQFDVPTGTAIFKTFVEKPIEEVIEAHVDNYDKQLNYISEGVDSLHRLLLQMQKEDVEEEIIEKPKGKKNA
jgi:flagellar biosynthesis GTPase FlhF